MKKTFTFFAISALFLMLLFPVSVKADTTLSFVYTQKGYDPGSGTKKYCNGYDADKDKWIADGDFNWNQTTDNVAQQEVSSVKWTGVDQAQACTRSDVSFSAADYTLTLLTYRTNHPATMTLPSISINGGDPICASEARWGVSSTETIVSNQFNYTNDNGKGAFQTEVRLIYHTKIDVANSYGISVSFPSGYDRFKDYVKTLTISQDAPATPTYAVTVNNDGNGTASADKAKYEAGETVTLTAEPNANYLFDGWTTSDNGFSFADEHSASTTFAMPAKAVTVQANFVACSGQTVTVNVNDENMGSATGGGSYCAGSQVYLTATPKSGYRFVNWTVSGSASLDNENNASTHFTMSNPAEAVTVQANFEVDPCTNTKTVQCVSGYVPVTIHDYNHANQYVEDKHETYVVTTSGNNISAYYYPLSLSTTISSFTLSIHMANSQNNYAWFNLYKKTANNSGDVEYDGAYYNKVGWQHMVSSGSWNPDEFDDAINSFADGSEGVSSSIPSGDYLLALSAKNDARFYYFTLTTSENIFCPNTITMAKSGDDGAVAPTAQVNSSNVTTAFEGTEVTVTAGAPSANHYFSGWTVLPENAVTFDAPASPTTTFVMPAEDVTITAKYGEVVSSKFTYTTSGSGSITCDTPSNSNVNSGTPISMTAVPSTDYVFTGWTATEGTFSDESELTTTFTMPAEAATVTANFAQVDNVIVTGIAATITAQSGYATLTVTSVPDFDAFNHNVLKFAYSDMEGKYKGQKVAFDEGYNFASSAQATGFGFYYKTEKADDHVAFCFDPQEGQEKQVKWQLAATNNVWKYVYIPRSEANSWNRDGIIIYMNGDDKGNYSTWNGQDTHTTYKDAGAFYMSEIAATSITFKPDINTYTYTREKASNSYGTLCLPMDGSVSGATLYSVAGKQEEGGKIYIVLEEQEATLAAGEPYIFEADGSTLTATMSGPHSAVKADANGLVGTYQQITAPVYNGSDDLNYVLALDDSNNTVFKKVGADVTVGAYRAYINIKNAGDYSPASAAPGRKYIRFGIEGSEEAQAVEMIYDDASLRTRKIMQNGHLYILRDGHLFTAQGTQIK